MDDAPALRLMFRHRGREVALEAALKVDVRPLPTMDLTRDPGAAHFYVELQTSDGRVVYRRLRPNPLGDFFEVPTGDPAAPFHYREGNEEVSGYFSVLVPRSETARFVEIFGSGPGFEPPRSLGRFDVAAVPDRWTPPLEGL